MDTYALMNFTRSDLQLFITRNNIDAQTRATLEKFIDLKARIADVDARIAANNKEAEEISQDQERLRENIKALTATAEAKQLIARYVSKADEQETRLEQLTKDRRALSEERARVQAEFDTALRELDISKNLTQ
jgi:uncharacterized protein (DUF3084 family)